VRRRKRAAIIRAATGDDVIVGEAELRHAMRHFTLPRDLVLALIQRILEHPTVVLADDKAEPHEYRLFYRLDDGRYLLAVVKLTPAGSAADTSSHVTSFSAVVCTELGGPASLETRRSSFI